jgi:uncharacterized protein YndB with AHSA1/START domain
MSSTMESTARAVADLTEGLILATVEIAAPPERVFRALASKEITEWWVRPGVFDTREWSGDVRVGGRWRATGVARGRPYALEGEFLEIDAPHKLVHTWHLEGMPDAASVVTYLLEPIAKGTRITLRHSANSSRESSIANSAGWESSFQRLEAYLAAG